MSFNGLQLPGTLSVTQPPLNPVGLTMVDTAIAVVATEDRTSVNGTITFDYYIQVEYDINGAITYHNASDTNGEDDAYSMTTITVNKTTDPDAALVLPGALNVPVPAGNIDAQGLDGNVGGNGNFLVMLSITVNPVGIMTSSITISGTDYIATKLDDPEKAQVVYWENIETMPAAADVNELTADVLSSTLTPAELTSYYSIQTNAINAYYDDKPMITDWTISFIAQQQDANNELSKHARHLDRNGGTIFQTNDKLVCQTYCPYGVSIEDYQGTVITIVATNNIYGVLKQT